MGVYQFIIVVFLLIIVVVLVLLMWNQTKKSGPEQFQNQAKQISNKTIWLYWLKGWDRPTDIVQKVRDSWQHLNPEWNIVLIDNNNIHTYLDEPYLFNGSVPDAYKAELIGIHLLAKYGGVWADASVLCMMPLDLWINDALRPSGFWMYRGGYGDVPVFWFIIAEKQSYIIQKLKECCSPYWDSRRFTFSTSWLEETFVQLVKIDKMFEYKWTQVPYLDCDAEGQSNMLDGKHESNDRELQHILQFSPPYVLKLEPALPQSFEQSNTYAAIGYALAQEHAPYPLHNMKQLIPQDNMRVTDEYHGSSS